MIRRWDIGRWGMRRDKEGPYILYEDYAALKNKNKIKVEIRQQDDFVPGFAAYAKGSVKPKCRAQVILNVSNLMGLVAAKAAKPKDIPRILADFLFHEFIHVLEDWAGTQFSEKKVHKLVEKYRKLYQKEKA